MIEKNDGGGGSNEVEEFEGGEEVVLGSKARHNLT
jgi:hypothetical protein